MDRIIAFNLKIWNLRNDWGNFRNRSNQFVKDDSPPLISCFFLVVLKFNKILVHWIENHIIHRTNLWFCLPGFKLFMYGFPLAS